MGSGALVTHEDFDLLFERVTICLREMEIEAPALRHCLLPDSHPIIVGALQRHQKNAESRSETTKAEARPGKHMNYCCAAGLRWPAEPSASTSVSPCFPTLSVRERGILNISQEQHGELSTVDVSQELEMQRVIRPDQNHIPTLLPGSTFVASFPPEHGCPGVSRLITGVESLWLQSFPVTDAEYASADFPDSLYADVASNAFAGNVLGAPVSAVWQCIQWRHAGDVQEDDLLNRVMGMFQATLP